VCRLLGDIDRGVAVSSSTDEGPLKACTRRGTADTVDGMGSLLFRHRLAALVLLLVGPLIGAFALSKHPIGLRTTSELVGMPIAFAATAVALLIAFVLRTTGEARLGNVVYGQGEGARVVTSGPFRLQRHPLYVGTSLAIVGLSAPFLPPLFIAVLAVLTALTVSSIAGYEEGALAAKFGDAWTRYAQAVPRFVGVPGKVDDDGVRTTARGWTIATLSNLGLLSFGLYRLAVAAGVDEGPRKVLGLVNVVCVLVWAAMVLGRRAVNRLTTMTTTTHATGM
jgi:protein-S-isoprenylcysteine O-methyltransferase Ste14